MPYTGYYTSTRRYTQYYTDLKRKIRVYAKPNMPLARHRCNDRPPPARLEKIALVIDFAHKERSGRHCRQVAPERPDVANACKMASMMTRTEDTAALF